jgi:hypothetical protein
MSSAQKREHYRNLYLFLFSGKNSEWRLLSWVPQKEQFQSRVSVVSVCAPGIAFWPKVQ